MTWPGYVIECSTDLLFVFLAITAYRRGWFDVAVMACAALFGMAIELYFVHGAAGYHYGEFMVMIAGAPLWVALGWACIMYASLRTADALPIREWGKPGIAALMAVSLDMALDPVADGLHWWTWARADDFFGVAYDNFIGWFMIVGYFLGSVVVLRAWKGEAYWIPLLSIPVAMVGVVLTQFGLEWLYGVVGSEGPVFLVVSLAVTTWALLALDRVHLSWFQLAVPAYFHLLFAVLLLTTDLSVKHPELYGVFALAASLSLVLYLYATDEPEPEGRSAPP